MSIACDKVSFVYNPKAPFKCRALDNVSLTIEDGEFVAIVGHTGSGKSTFLQHLNALLRLQEGNLTVCGIDLADKKVDLKKLRGKVGMVFQYPEYQLFADTVEEDVAFGPKNMGMTEEEVKERVQQGLQMVGLDYQTFKSRSPFDLSGGEKRRVAFAGVLAMNPEVLVLDEPTAGLDPVGKAEILSLVKKLNREKGITVIMVSHDMNEVYENCDRVIVFKEGKVAYDLPPQELFEKEDEIASMNLEVPFVAQLLNYLNANGVAVSRNAKTVEQVYDELNRLANGGVK